MGKEGPSPGEEYAKTRIEKPNLDAQKTRLKVGPQFSDQQDVRDFIDTRIIPASDLKDTVVLKKLDEDKLIKKIETEKSKETIEKTHWTLTTIQEGEAGTTIQEGEVGSKEKPAEDRAFEIPKQDMAVVSDGMGGTKAGEIASNMVEVIFKRQFNDLIENQKNNFTPEQFELKVKDIFKQTSEAIKEYGESHNEYENMGATATVLKFYRDTETNEEMIKILYAGDSRAYVFRGGKLTQLTLDNNKYIDAVKERFGEEKAFEFQLRLSDANDPAKDLKGVYGNFGMEAFKDRAGINQALGVKEDLKVSVHTGKVVDGDIYLACTDGLTDNLTHTIIEAIMQDDLEKIKDIDPDLYNHLVIYRRDELNFSDDPLAELNGNSLKNVVALTKVAVRYRKDEQPEHPRSKKDDFMATLTYVE